MNAWVVDTNVAVVANARSPQAGPDCVASCVAKLLLLVQDGCVVLDAGFEILREYMRQLSLAGQPGTGDYFLKWVWLNQENSARCERVAITPDTARGYAEFPDAVDLAGFDLSDRKFVAVARASGKSPTVLNAVDSDWWLFGGALQANDVRVEHLCPEQVAGWQRKRIAEGRDNGTE